MLYEETKLNENLYKCMAGSSVVNSELDLVLINDDHNIILKLKNRVLQRREYVWKKGENQIYKILVLTLEANNSRTRRATEILKYVLETRGKG